MYYCMQCKGGYAIYDIDRKLCTTNVNEDIPKAIEQYNLNETFIASESDFDFFGLEVLFSFESFDTVIELYPEYFI